MAIPSNLDDFPRVLAVHNYHARSDQELSFQAGELLVITEMLSEDWLEGVREGGARGLIAAAYVEHVTDWYGIAERGRTDRNQSNTHSPEHEASTAAETSAPFHRSHNSAHATSAASTDASTSERRGYNASALPGLVKESSGQVPSTAGKIYGEGASEEELIKPKPLARQPDQPDLAKALSIRNQAAKIGAPQKTGPSELSRHISALKTKKMYRDRITDDPQTAELKKRLQQQSIHNRNKEKSQEVSELQKRVSAIRQKPQ